LVELLPLHLQQQHLQQQFVERTSSNRLQRQQKSSTSKVSSQLFEVTAATTAMKELLPAPPSAIAEEGRASFFPTT
jgi:hypothetical protein